MYLPTNAYHATRYADWTYATWQRYPRLAQAAPAHPQARVFAIVEASASVDHAPSYTIVDCHGDGAAAYYAPRRTLAPALTDWQSEVLAAVRHLRRWHYYADSPSD